MESQWGAAGGRGRSRLAEQDFHAEPEMYLGCTRCFRHFTFPNTWMAVEPYAAQDSEASISLSSDTDESVDTQSDKEAIVLPEIERAQVPRALTRFPPVPQGRTAGGEGAGAEGPETPSQARSRTAARTGAEGPEMRQRDPTACGEGGPPQRPARRQLMRSVRWGWHQFYSHQLLRGAAQWSWAILPFWH